MILINADNVILDMLLLIDNVYKDQFKIVKITEIMIKVTFRFVSIVKMDFISKIINVNLDQYKIVKNMKQITFVENAKTILS